MTAVEEFDISTTPVARWRPHRRRRWSRRPATWVVVACVLVVLGIVAAPAPRSARSPESDGLPWNLLDLDLRSEPVPLWQASIGASEAVGVIDGTLLVRTETLGDDAIGPVLVGVDLATGSELFEVTDPENTCQLGSRTMTCVEERGGPAAALVVRDDQGTITAETHYAGALSAVALDDGGYVVIEGAPSGVADLVRIDGDGVERWRSATSFSGRVDTSYNRLDLVDGWIETASGAFDLPTGEPPQGLVRFAETDAAGSMAVATSEGTVVSTAAGERVVLPADEPLLQIDDAAGGPFALTGNDGTIAVIHRDESAPLWTITEDQCWVIARVQSTLMLRCFEANGSRMLALDQVTGRSLWAQDVRGWSELVGATPDTLLMSSSDEIAGVDPRTGHTQWRIQVPGTIWSVETIAGTVVVLTDQALIRLA